jgi:5-bromo-4-chloroindolyl phosphate hydrolysis protein
MEHGSSDEREIRAARNQAMFRAVNEKIRALNETFSELTQTYSIVCECANNECIEALEITAEAYAAIRKNPRQFPVLRGHVLPEVEHVVDEGERYVVVEKFGEAGEIVEATDPRAELSEPSRG